MNQPTNPVPPRGVRPQLFSAPKARAAGHADFGSNILATIDGGQVRSDAPRGGGVARRLTWLITALLMVGLAYYLGTKLSESQPLLIETSAPVAVVPAKPVVQVTETPVGAAAIETVVAQPVLAMASAPLEIRSTAKSPIVKPTVAAPKKSEVRTAAEKPANAVTKTATSGDTDADLLAAMLPHVKHQGGVTVSSSTAASAAQPRQSDRSKP